MAAQQQEASRKRRWTGLLVSFLLMAVPGAVVLVAGGPWAFCGTMLLWCVLILPTYVTSLWER